MNSLRNKFDKQQRMFGAVLLFIMLDLTVLLINYQIAYQVTRDAVAINLSGRQRMLTQRMTKSLLELQSPGQVEQVAIEKEFRSSLLTFDQTLQAFDLGGTVIGGDGKLATLQRINDSAKSHELIDQAQLIWKPLQTEILPFIVQNQPIPQDKIELARQLMLKNNLQLLSLMNDLTSNLELESRQRADMLRILQTLVFVLALANFIAIVRSFHLLTKQATQSTLHFGELARRDPLTGLFNRRQFDEALADEVAAARQRQGGFALLLIDLDNFKPVNDLHGHSAGDTVLRTIAARLSAHAHSHDTLARIGGDEFVLLCPDLCSEQATADLCERLLTSVNEPIPLNPGQVNVGASIGVAFYPDHAEKLDDLIHIADQAMYETKKTGRNGWFFGNPNNP